MQFVLIISQRSPYNRGPNRVTIGVHMEPIFKIDIGFRLAIRTEHVRENIDKGKFWIFPRVVFNEAIGLFHTLDLAPARGIWGN